MARKSARTANLHSTGRWGKNTVNMKERWTNDRVGISMCACSLTFVHEFFFSPKPMEKLCKMTYLQSDPSWIHWSLTGASHPAPLCAMVRSQWRSRTLRGRRWAPGELVGRAALALEVGEAGARTCLGDGKTIGHLWRWWQKTESICKIIENLWFWSMGL